MLRGCLLFFLCLLTVRAHARVHKIVIESSKPLAAHEGATAYVELRGLAYGDLQPRDLHNSIIQDIVLAPKNRNGAVEYAATFTLQMPLNPLQSSGLMLYEVVNRGASILPRDYTTGDVFLRSGWQGDIPFRGRAISGGEAETIDVPVARNMDGSAITGPILLQFLNASAGTTTLPTKAAVGYATSGEPPLPFDRDTANARLITRSYESVDGALGTAHEVAAGDWRWADCTEQPFPGTPSDTHVCLRQGFDPALAYQLQYRGKDPKVLAIGLAAIRDINAFFRDQAQDDAGWKNPLAGTVKHVIGEGASQSGNTLRTFLNLGFNESESGTPVFDGAMVMIAARQNPINFRFAVPGGASNLYEPGSDGVVWWADWPDGMRHHPAAGLLTRCNASHTCPKIVEVLGSSEFWSLRASPDFVGTDDSKDIPLPTNVRRYYIASTQHGGGAGGFDWQPKYFAQKRAATSENPIPTMGCVLPLNPNPHRETDNALLAALKLWVSRGVEPPPSRYPTLKSGDLVPANRNAMRFPEIPGTPAPDGIANPLLVYAFGNDFVANDLSGFIDQQPPLITGVVYPLVPRVDLDGNEIGGVHTVLQQAPLGTYLGWNVTAEGFMKGHYCSLNGGYIPFASTRAQRQANGDPRLSLEERYGTNTGYTCVVKRAIQSLLTDRLLLQRDADHLLQQGTSADIPSDEKATPEARALAARLCH